MKIPDDLSITLLGKEITSSKSAKNLGVTMDCNLTYDEHITQFEVKTSKCILGFYMTSPTFKLRNYGFF